MIHGSFSKPAQQLVDMPAEDRPACHLLGQCAPINSPPLAPPLRPHHELVRNSRSERDPPRRQLRAGNSYRTATAPCRPSPPLRPHHELVGRLRRLSLQLAEHLPCRLLQVGRQLERLPHGAARQRLGLARHQRLNLRCKTGTICTCRPVTFNPHRGS